MRIEKGLLHVNFFTDIKYCGWYRGAEIPFVQNANVLTDDAYIQAVNLYAVDHPDIRGMIAVSLEGNFPVIMKVDE